MKKNISLYQRTRDLFWEQSQCIDSWLHRFELVAQYEEGVMERCAICGEEVFFPIVDGRIDNTEYLSYHARQALMPQHELFKREYNKYE